jgi:hypothetical protein
MQRVLERLVELQLLDRLDTDPHTARSDDPPLLVSPRFSRRCVKYDPTRLLSEELARHEVRPASQPALGVWNVTAGFVYPVGDRGEIDEDSLHQVIAVIRVKAKSLRDDRDDVGVAQHQAFVRGARHARIVRTQQLKEFGWRTARQTICDPRRIREDAHPFNSGRETTRELRVALLRFAGVETRRHVASYLSAPPCLTSSYVTLPSGSSIIW